MNSAKTSTIRKPFMEHVHEFRRRLLWCALFFAIGGGIGYGLYDTLLHIVQAPLDQTLYFTSPTGGFNFVFKVCAVFGFLVALPMLVYQLLKFLEPATQKIHRIAVLTCIIWSANLAYIGILFGYLVSLPAALHFLTRFGGEQIQALITADEYFNFALAYIAGFALLFQLPLIILLINRIKPLKPGGMMKAQRWVILFSFVAAAILTPTPDPINQLIMAVPVVLLYQLSILLVWFINKAHRPKTVKPQKSIAPKRSTLPKLLTVAVEEINEHRSITIFDQPNSAAPLSRIKSISGIVRQSPPAHTHTRPQPQQAQPVASSEVRVHQPQVGKLIDIMA